GKYGFADFETDRQRIFAEYLHVIILLLDFVDTAVGLAVIDQFDEVLLRSGEQNRRIVHAFERDERELRETDCRADILTRVLTVYCEIRSLVTGKELRRTVYGEIADEKVGDGIDESIYIFELRGVLHRKRISSSLVVIDVVFPALLVLDQNRFVTVHRLCGGTAGIAVFHFS